MRFQQVQKL